MTFITVRGLCERFAVSEDTVLGWIRRGELVAVNVGRRQGSRKPRWRISEKALAAFEAARTASPPPPKPLRRKRQPDVVQFF